jgi:hypothetical protein
MNKFRVLLVLLLCSTVTLQGCSVSQFSAVLNEVEPAIVTILQIVALVKGTTADLSPATKVGGDIANIEKIYGDWQTASAAAKPGIEAQLNVLFDTLNNDLAPIFSIAQVNNTNVQAKVTAFIALIQTAVNIAEAVIPATAKRFGTNAPVKMDAETLVKSWNNILVAKTGNAMVDNYTPHHKLHYHGLFVRTITVGHAQ